MNTPHSHPQSPFSTDGEPKNLRSPNTSHTEISPDNFTDIYQTAATHNKESIPLLFKPDNDLFICSKSKMVTYPRRAWLVDADDTAWRDNYHFSEVITDFCSLCATTGTDLSETEIRMLIDNLGKKMLTLHGFGPIGFHHALTATWEQVFPNLPLVGSEAEEKLQQALRYLSNGPYYIREDAYNFLDRIDSSPDDVAVLFTLGPIEIQAGKVARSNLASRFESIAFSNKKDPTTYKLLTERLPYKPEEYIVIGNSLSHEVAPALALGLKAFHLNNPESWHSGTHSEIDPSLYTTVDTLVEAFELVTRK